MPLSYAELEQFYEGLVSRARSRGITCAITSGMACVSFGVSEATKDCDLLCSPDCAGVFMKKPCGDTWSGWGNRVFRQALDCRTNTTFASAARKSISR
jgi:hypothetical protein